MRQSEYQVIAEVERNHWWYEGRRKILENLLEKFSSSSFSLIYDIGCGTGANFDTLSKFRRVIGIDFSEDAINFCKKKEYYKLIKSNVCDLSIIENDSGDIIVATDILEHLDDDKRALQELYRILKRGGFAIFMVPAFMSLWSSQDEVSQHKRRYTKKEFMNKIEIVGFTWEKITYFNIFLFLPILLTRKLIRLLHINIDSENKINNVFVNYLFKKIFLLEAKLLKRINFPFGVSILCIAKK
jgi:SAM-dependent methyltransferase